MEQSTILAAYSGGKDSTALLHLLLKLKTELKLNLVAAYYNHGIRFDAPQEESWAIDQCAALGIPLLIGQGHIPERLKETGGNLEEIASRERYRFLQDSLATLPRPAFLATAHHAGDQLETLLFRLARGSGPQGLLGIAEQIDGQIIRPLLAFSPGQIRDFLLRNKIPCYHDSSNDDLTYSRNRIRHQVLPELEKLNSEFYANFNRSHALLSDEDHFLQEYTLKTFKQLSPMDGTLYRPAFLTRPVALQRRILRLFISRIRGHLRSIEHQHVESLREAITTCLKGCHLPGLDLSINRHWITSLPKIPPIFSDIIDGDEKSRFLPLLNAPLSQVRVPMFKIDRRNRSATILEDRLIYPLTIRSPQPTDRYRRQNTPYDSRVWEMLRERGIPLQLRHLFPLVINGDGVPIWCFGCPLSASFHSIQPLQTHQKYLRLEIRKHPFYRFL